MSSHKRVVDDVGLVHYADKWWQHVPEFMGTWCGRNGRTLVRKGSTRERITCWLCLWERTKRGGHGSLL
jgi:hypothetical protein